ncbi:hypothetical protein VMCG_03996 [Cytospora schulzeri]|uniref:Uncharacterized protein n=1 Tax=Cytospora schulzeri TaxID=448051 RepID=A0A423WUB7_9PEZI|nr:hypothetical protein VMCG_03996 [Valsa malicola]
MCAITVSLALCDSTCPYPNSDIPAGCLKIYPFTAVEIHCPESEGVLGFCGRVEIFKSEDDEDGSRIVKRICESCVAWSALMRNRDGKRAEKNVRRNLPESREEQDGLDSDGQEAVMTPGGSSDPSEFELDL